MFDSLTMFDAFTWEDIYKCFFIFVSFNLFYLSMNHFDELCEQMLFTFEKFGRKISVWKRLICNTFILTLNLSKVGWFFLKIRMRIWIRNLRNSPSDTPPTIIITKIDKNTLLLEYTYQGHNYKLYTSPRKETQIVDISDESGKDVSNLLRPFMGPGEDFHEIEYTPSQFGLQKLTLLNIMGEEKSFEDDEIITTTF